MAVHAKAIGADIANYDLASALRGLPIADDKVDGKQSGITCGAIEEASRSSNAINERVIIYFRDKNAVTLHFCDKNGAF